MLNRRIFLVELFQSAIFLISFFRLLWKEVSIGSFKSVNFRQKSVSIRDRETESFWFSIPYYSVCISVIPVWYFNGGQNLTNASLMRSRFQTAPLALECRCVANLAKTCPNSIKCATITWSFIFTRTKCMATKGSKSTSRSNHARLRLRHRRTCSFSATLTLTCVDSIRGAVRQSSGSECAMRHRVTTLDRHMTHHSPDITCTLKRRTGTRATSLGYSLLQFCTTAKQITAISTSIRIASNFYLTCLAKTWVLWDFIWCTRSRMVPMTRHCYGKCTDSKEKQRKKNRGNKYNIDYFHRLS